MLFFKTSILRSAFRSLSKPTADLLIICGPSGGGKSKLLKLLVSEFPDQFGYSVSHTTRQPRVAEVHGESYFFVSKEGHADMVQNGSFLEHAVVHGNSYGTSEDSVRQVLRQNKVVCMDIDVQGAQSIKAHRSQFRTFSGFVTAKGAAELERRLRERPGETEDQTQLRLANGKRELAWYQAHPSFFDFYLETEETEITYPLFRKVVMAGIWGMTI